MANRLLNLLKKIYPTPATLPVSAVEDVVKAAQDKDTDTKFKESYKAILSRLGSYTSQISDEIFKSTMVNFERVMLYREIDRALMHWLVGSAAELFADYSTTYDKLRNATVWVTSESKTYQNELNNMLHQIDIEEKIYDWGYTTGVYGDHFVQPEAIPGMGIVGVNDDDHPMNVSRLDYNTLIGFYRTPTVVGGTASTQAELLPPWEYVHFRLLGAKKRRSVHGDPLFSQYSSVHFLSQDPRQMSSKYGTSLLVNALPAFKRLRLAEDSLLMARATRGVEKYIYKVKVDSENVEAVDSIIDQYASLLKKARAIDTRPTNPYFDQQMQLLSVMEDIIIPVWGDVNDLAIEKIGGDANIRWIVDIVEARNQLASSLRVPLALLGGFTQEATGALGATSIEQLDIRFGRTAKRVQRALIQGITRLCQIHLSYIGMDPDPALFEVNMPETSTAEEESIKETLSTSVDAIARFMEMLNSVEGVQFKQAELLDFLSQKIIRLGDFQIEDYIETGQGLLTESKRAMIDLGLDYIANSKALPERVRPRWGNNGDVRAWTYTDKDLWEAKFGKESACQGLVEVKTVYSPEVKK